MSRTFARRLVSTWDDKNFRSLDLAHQGLYDALCSSPDLSRCGVLNWIPSRLVVCSDGLTEPRLKKMAALLIDRDYLRLDTASGELLVRSHIRNDEVLRTPNISKAMARAYQKLHSPYIKDSVVRELARLYAEDPKLPGWPSVSLTNADLYSEVVQHPLSEQIGQPLW